MNKIKTYIFLFLFLCFNAGLTAQVFVDWNSQWSYFKGVTEPSQPNTLWVGKTFNAAAWAKGNAPFRYGDGSGGTELTDMADNYTTFYIRKEFKVEDVDAIDEFEMSLDYDDGMVVWINGKEILNYNSPANYRYDQTAPNNHESGEAIRFTLTKNNANIETGTNIIAVQGFNISKSSSDFFLHLKLEGITKLEETEGVTCDTPSGFYSKPFYARIKSDVVGEKVKYTLDGSDPRYSSAALLALTPAVVLIDPKVTTAGRGKTGGVVLRASKIEEGFAPSKPLTHTYIFTAFVKTQAHPGGAWPTSRVNGQEIDLPMDEKVTLDLRYKDLMEDALLDIPSISITTDPANLFDTQLGIYVNASYHGSDWEREANIELINPDGSQGFNIDAGIRIRGGWSRHDGYPKHAFRLFFRSDYGESKLEFPLFGDEGVDEFDKIDLRSTQNYSWANGGDNGKHNTMNRDVFSRDCQKDMLQPHTRSRYYHLYLNGLYWGVYQTQERAEAAFADSYFGGKKDDYDVIKVDIGENWNVYEVEATDGNIDAWKAIWDMCEKGFSSDKDYFNLLGLNEKGEIDTTLNVWIDVDNLIDYMLIIFYGGNFDAPVSKFSGNHNPNNFFAIYNRTKKREGFKFLIHDAEHTLLTDPVGPGVGLIENRVNIGNTNVNKMNVTAFEKFQPQWLHHKLTENKEYRIKFADRVYRHFFNDGVFTVDSCISRFKKTADKLDLAVIAESARWGDAGTWQARNKIDDWIPAINRVVDDYMPFRTDIVLNQLIDEDLYSTNMKAPVFTNNGIEIKQSKITIDGNYNLTLENKNVVGSVIYTTDGSDPRMAGGTKRTSALNGGSKKTINILPGMHVKARVQYTTTWSPLHEIYFEDSGLFTDLKVTELHYHPTDQDTVGGKEFEFIELKNIGDKTLDLSGLAFTDGIQFTFPEGSILPPKAFFVLASNEAAFASLYGFNADFQYSGSLSNGGEKVVLETNTGQMVIAFTYSDDLPWPEEADGDGFSLVSVDTNPGGNPDSVYYWTISKYINGSPMADDENSLITKVEVLVENDMDFNVYPNPATSAINIDFMLNAAENVEIGLYDLNGRRIQTLVNEPFYQGYHSENVRLSGFQSGVYILAFKTKSSISTRKLIYKGGF